MARGNDRPHLPRCRSGARLPPLHEWRGGRGASCDTRGGEVSASGGLRLLGLRGGGRRRALALLRARLRPRPGLAEPEEEALDALRARLEEIGEEPERALELLPHRLTGRALLAQELLVRAPRVPLGGER